MTDSSASLPGDLASAVERDRASSIRRRRRLVLAAVAVLLLPVPAWFLAGGSDKQSEYRTVAATVGRLVVTVNATGTLQPTNEVDVGSELSGLVETVSVDYNDRVKKGQVIARLDTSKFASQVLQSKAQLAVAEATLTERRASVIESEAVLSRMTAVRESSAGRVPSKQDYDAAKATLARARATVTSAEAQVDQARAQLDFDATNLAKTEIRAPIDGVVLTRDVDPGQTIAASFTAPKLFQLAEDLAHMELEVDVDEADVGQVREGQQATFTVDAYAERSFPARIRQLRYASETVNGVVTYKAVLQVDNADLALRPGMTATADIIVATVEDALLIPNEALRFVPPHDDGDKRGLLQKLMPFSRRLSEPAPSTARSDNKRTVYRLDQGRPSQVEIHIGLSDGRRTQILGEALPAGTELVVDVRSESSS